MSVIKGAENLRRAVSLDESYDASSKLIKYLRGKLDEYYKVYNGLIERPGNVNVFVINLKGKSAEGRPLYENGIPILYYNTSSVIDDDAEDDEDGSDAEDSGSDAEDSGSDAEDSGSENDEDSGSDDEGSDDEETKTVTTASSKKKVSSSSNDKELRKTARAIANTIKNMHIAFDKKDLIHKIHQLGDVVLAKAYTRNVFDASSAFKSDDERRQCKAGIDDATLDFVFLDVAARMPEISPSR